MASDTQKITPIAHRLRRLRDPFLYTQTALPQDIKPAEDVRPTVQRARAKRSNAA